MFYLNGRFMEASIARHGTVATVRGRLRRILYPYWLFAGAMLLIMYMYDSWRVVSVSNALTWILPIAVPEGAPWQGGWMTEPLWYVRTYLWLLLTVPFLRFFVKRGNLPLVMIWSGGAYLAAISWGSQWWAVQDYLTFGACFLLGVLGARRHWRRGELIALAGLGVAGGVATAGEVLAGGGVVNDNHALHLSLGLVMIAAIEGVRPRIETALSRARHWRIVEAVNSRSVSIYLWHPIAIAGANLVVGRVVGGMVLRVGALFAAGALLWAMLALVGVVEDYAGKTTISPAGIRSAVLRSTAGAAAVGIFVLSTDAASRYDLPPVPSKAPPSATAGEAGSKDLENLLLGDPFEAEKHNDEPSGVYAVPSQESIGEAGGLDGPGPADAPLKAAEGAVREPGRVDSQPEPGQTAPALRPIPRWESLAGEDAATDEAVENVVRDWVLEEKIGGVEVAILRPGVGRAEVAIDSDGSRVALSETVPLASITKTFTAALLLRAVDDGLLDLYQPIGELKAAPWFTMTEEITAGQLLTHRSGLVHYTELDAWKRDWRTMDGWKPALEAAMEEGFTSTPGSVTSYSSTNYIVAGLLAAQIYGKPIEELIKTNLLEPLELKDTSVGKPSPGSPGTGTGNMRASLADVARWGMTLWRDQLVLGPAGNKRLRDINPSTMIGYGSFAWCPCRSDETGFRWSSIGHNGAEATVRYYPGIDLVLAMRIPGGVGVRAERLIDGIVEAVQRN
jgi:CubicO group peptidase (beta-lactamase class C family)/peptidoglycan/LPS O-acetylase OafA/YrhL